MEKCSSEPMYMAGSTPLSLGPALTSFHTSQAAKVLSVSPAPGSLDEKNAKEVFPNPGASNGPEQHQQGAVQRQSSISSPCAAHPDPLIVQTSTGELLQFLGEYVCRRCPNLRDLNPEKVTKWFRDADFWLLQRGQEHSFITPANVVFVYMICREAIGDHLDSEDQLQATFLTCLYLAYSYVGTETSYPLRPFLIETDKGAFWQRCLTIADCTSAKMMQINSDTHYFTQVLQDLCNDGIRPGKNQNVLSVSPAPGTLDEKNAKEVSPNPGASNGPEQHQQGAVLRQSSVRSSCTSHEDPVIVQASTRELLQFLGEYVCRWCPNLRDLNPEKVTQWFHIVDSWLLPHFQDHSFITPANVVFVYMICREAIGDHLDSEDELQATFLTCLYLAYSYMGAETSYPLWPFLVETDRGAFWKRCLTIIDCTSAKMMQINTDPHYFIQVLQDLCNVGIRPGKQQKKKSVLTSALTWVRRVASSAKRKILRKKAQSLDS